MPAGRREGHPPVLLLIVYRLIKRSIEQDREPADAGHEGTVVRRTAEPYAEDAWSRLTAGHAPLRSVHDQAAATGMLDESLAAPGRRKLEPDIRAAHVPSPWPA